MHGALSTRTGGQIIGNFQRANIDALPVADEIYAA
jgi:hypothetical protein